jgi:hypothetical protein
VELEQSKAWRIVSVRTSVKCLSTKVHRVDERDVQADDAARPRASPKRLDASCSASTTLRPHAFHDCFA